jgi:hydroxymethylpyrimidine/phosphomethylpyrimidine kinase
VPDCRGAAVAYAPGVLIPTALSIAGLDPSGGAGLAADLRSFGAAGVWGAAVCAALTVQSTRGVRAVRAVPAALVLDQAREVLADARVRAVKTGALGSAANVRAVLVLLAERPGLPSVVDPVMIPSRRADLVSPTLHGGAVRPLRALAAAATLVTPNLAEAAALLGELVSDDDAPEAAAALVAAGAQAALVKGGHGHGPEAVDWLALRGGRLVRLARPRRAIPAVHGAGCTLASLIAGRLAARLRRGAARAEDLVDAVRWARARLDRALAAPLAVGAGLHVMDVRWRRS